jgi:hypothetical protein
VPTDLATAAIERLDLFVASLEQRWGVDRLARLVPPELRVRFERQRDLLARAMAEGDAQVIALQAEGMRRAWQALDKAATAGGAEPLAVTVWECRLPTTGQVVAIVHTAAEAHLVAQDREVWTLGEVALLLEHLGDGLRQARAAFPGAELAGMRRAEDSVPGTRERTGREAAERCGDGARNR